jgi:hypothetical protein
MSWRAETEPALSEAEGTRILTSSGGVESRGPLAALLKTDFGLSGEVREVRRARVSLVPISR